MKKSDLYSILVKMVVLLTVALTASGRARAQASPGSFADANHPSGPVGPMKENDIWHVDPLTGAVTIHIPFTTTPSGGRGPHFPFSLSYNSASTVLLQELGVFVTGGSGVSYTNDCEPNASCIVMPAYLNSGADVTITDIFSWSPPFLGQGPTGPWTTTGPFLTTQFDVIQDMALPPSGQNNGLAEIYGGTGCTTYGPFTYTDETGAAHDMNLYFIQENYGVNQPQSGQTTQNGYTAACAPLNGSGTTPSATTDGSAMLTSYSTSQGIHGNVLIPTEPCSWETSN